MPQDSILSFEWSIDTDDQITNSLSLAAIPRDSFGQDSPVWLSLSTFECADRYIERVDTLMSGSL
jgi:hypothetical protein